MKAGEPFEVGVWFNEVKNYWQAVTPKVESVKSGLEPSLNSQKQGSVDSDLVEVKRFFKILEACSNEGKAIVNIFGLSFAQPLGVEILKDIAATVYINAKRREGR